MPTSASSGAFLTAFRTNSGTLPEILLAGVAGAGGAAGAAAGWETAAGWEAGVPALFPPELPVETQANKLRTRTAAVHKPRNFFMIQSPYVFYAPKRALYKQP
jgi:hypothetical protein